LNFIFKAVFSVNTDRFQNKIKNEVICDATYLTIEILKNALSNIDARRDLFTQGTETAIRFLNSLDEFKSDSKSELKDSV
jgi:hypothetical protein